MSVQIDATGSLISFLRFALEDGAEGRELQLLGDYIRTALRLAGGRSSGCAGGIQPAIPGEVRTGGEEGRSDNLRLHGRAVPGAGRGEGHIRAGHGDSHGARGHPGGQHGHVRGADAGGQSRPAPRGIRRRLPGDIRQEAQADPQEPGDPGGGSRSGAGAGDGGQEVEPPTLIFIFFELFRQINSVIFYSFAA